MGLYLRTGPGSVPVHLTGTSGPALKVRIKKTQHLPFARPIYHNSPIVVYFSVHLIFPTRKEAASSPLPPFSIRKQHLQFPLSRGEYLRHKSLIFNKKISTRTSPLERGRGCVTSVHSLLKSKTSTRSQETRLHQTTAKTSHPMPHPSP